MNIKNKKAQTTIIALILVAQLILLSSSVHALTIKNVFSSPNEVAPGETVKIRLTIENELGEDLENVVVSLNLKDRPFAPYKSSTEKTIEEIDDGKDEDVSFELIALSNEEAGVYKIPVIIEYKLDEDEKATTKESFI